jgi:zinc protease
MLVGDLDPDAVAGEIESRLADWASSGNGRGRNGTLGATYPPRVGGDLSSTIFLVDKPGAAQSVIAAGHLSVPRLHDDYLPLVVMNRAFGGEFTARLNMNLREDKGYTYGYRSRLDWRLGPSAFVAGGSVQTAVTREALSETVKEFRDLHGNRPIGEEEFQKAQLGLIRGYPPSFETAGQILGRLIDLIHYGLPDDYHSGQMDRIRSVTIHDVRRVAEEHVDPDRLSIVVVGDRATIEPGLEELDLPIVHLDYEGEPVK